MRLLNAQSLELRTFFGDEIPPYAILSHTWSKDEVMFEDIRSGSFMKKHGFKKISYTLNQAREDSLDWAWIDTCKHLFTTNGEKIAKCMQCRLHR